MGGIYESWVNKETGEIINTCSIVTKKANQLMVEINNSKKRMPLILEKERMFDWIQPEITKDEIAYLMKPLDADLMAAHAISKLITSRTGNPNIPEVSSEFIYEELV